MSKSPLFLAVDVGASRTAAAIARVGADGPTAPTSFPLGRQAVSVPSAIFVGDGELLFGDAAVRRGIAQPERLIREFKRRIGDTTPLRAGDRRFAPEQLFALMVSWVADSVADREGDRPTALAVSIPVTWGDHRSRLVSGALERAGWQDVRLISEPEAAALHYSATGSLEPGALLGVYDLGGGTFDAALVRVESEFDLEVEGDPAGLPSFGGSDFDDLVVQHVVRAAGLSMDALAADEDARIGLAALRREAVDAKEALSFDSEAVIPVLVGDGQTTVRLTRSEFEGMIEAGVERTIQILEQLMESARVLPENVSAILLTGGSSRIPRIAQLLSERFDRPVAVDADPKAVISLGAVRAIAEAESPIVVRDGLVLVPSHEESDAAPGSEAAPAFTRPAPRRRWLGRAATIAAVTGGALVLAGGIAVAMLSLGDGAPKAQTTQSVVPTSTAPSEPLPPTTTSPSSSSAPLLTPAPPGTVIDIFPPATSAQTTSQPTPR